MAVLHYLRLAFFARPDKLNLVKPLGWTGPSLNDLAGDYHRTATGFPTLNDPHRHRWAAQGHVAVMTASGSIFP